MLSDDEDTEMQFIFKTFLLKIPETKLCTYFRN